MDLDAYLTRLGYPGSREPTLAVLRALQARHVQTVPFENLDIHLGRRIVLDETRLFDKIVNRRRGGYCYELNGLFAAALRQMGFDVNLVSAGVWDSDEGQFGPECDHLCLHVRLDGDWLADVGFGDWAREPLDLAVRGPQAPGPGRLYQVLADGDGYIAREQADGGEWRNAYRFTLQPLRLYDFTYGNHYMQTSPDTHFTQKRVCTLATPGGRLTLSDYRLIETEDGRRAERTLSGEDEWRSVLADRFGIRLD